MDVKIEEEIMSISNGTVISLTKVPDDIFSQKMMGDGFAIIPTEGKVYAPFNGEVISIFPSKHALIIKSKKGCELLIHVGLETVHLDGKHFENNVQVGTDFNEGDLLFTFEKDEIESKGIETIIPVIILNTPDYKKIDIQNFGDVKHGQIIVKLKSQKNIDQHANLSDDKNLLEQSIIQSLGGPDNIRTIGHCATRLRVTFVDESKVDRKTLSNITGVLGVVEAMGGLQIVIGNNINDVYQNILSMYHLSNVNNNEISKSEKKSIINTVLNVLSDILSPVVPLIMGSGLLSATIILLGYLGFDTNGSTFQILNIAANVVFYFLPLILAVTAAKRFKTEVIYALFIGGLFLHPSFISMVTSGNEISLFSLPVTAVDYSSSLLPIILSVWILSYVEKLANNYIPKSLRYVIKPVAIMLIMIPVVLIITGPAGYLMGEGLGKLIGMISGSAEWLAILILCTAVPFLVMTGMHIALTPLIILVNLENLGFDNMLLVAFLGMNFSQFAVALATFFKTKNKTLKGLAFTCAITAFFGGVTEPTLYGISVKMKKPLYATFIGCFANALCCIFLNLKVFSFAAPSFFTLPIFMEANGSNSNFISAIITICIVIIVTFAATWILGFDDSIYEEE